MRTSKRRKREMNINQERDDVRRKKTMRDKIGTKWASPKISLNFNRNENDFYRAVIEFYGIDVSGPSYEGRVFVNNLKASENTPLNEANGYVGSYHIFGHDGCWGDKDHCEVPPRRTYDSRIQSSLAPAYKYLNATKIIKKLIWSNSDATVTIIPIVGRGQRMSDAKDVVHISRIRINCYEKPLKINKSA
jgi:hypothetical protein